MNDPNISISEWAVMEALWEQSPLTASEVTQLLRPKTDWADNTVRTLLTRLVKKGALTVEKNVAGTRTFLPAVSRESIVKQEGESFAQRVFGGAAKPLITHFAQNSRLSADDVAELKRILDESLDA
ncbi:MAG: BlaI/MecI/CopY family transcriptional regulator [Planctomycetota bacterium]